MEEANILIERHELRLNTLERDVKALQDIRSELNRQLARNEEKIDRMESQPRARMQQIITAIVSALAGVLLSAAVGRFGV